jgi:hypothetical protein
LQKNKVRRHRGPFFFHCGDCGVAVKTPHPLKRYCNDCAVPHEKLMNKRRHKRMYGKPPRTVSCFDCGAVIHNAMPVQKRCPGCQILRELITGVSWRPLPPKVGKPINCAECGAAVMKYHSSRRLCNECMRKLACLKGVARYQENKLDPIWAGRNAAKAQRYRVAYRAALKQLLKNPERIEQAVMERINQLGIGGGNEFGS